jgi:hypothetical protein
MREILARSARNLALASFLATSLSCMKYPETPEDCPNSQVLEMGSNRWLADIRSKENFALLRDADEWHLAYTAQTLPILPINGNILYQNRCYTVKEYIAKEVPILFGQPLEGRFYVSH